MAVYTNRGGGGGSDVTIITNPSDEVKFEPLALPPMVDPRTYDVIGVGINAELTLDKPVNIYELYGNSRGGHLWFPDVQPIAGLGSGNLLAFASMNDDNFENLTDQFTVLLSRDHGATWDVNTMFDRSGFSNGPCCMRYYDDESGRLYEWLAFKSQPYPNDGQRQTFRCAFGYYAMTGAGTVKYVGYPHGSTFSGLPVPVTDNPWSGTYPGLDPRNSWAAFFGEGEVVEAADGSWFAVMDGELENPENPSGQDDYFSGFLYKSIDQGRTWEFVSYVPEREGGISECALFKGPSGKLVCVFNNFGPDRGGDNGANKVTISTDSTGTSWVPSFHPDEPNWTAGGRIGSCAPSSVKLADGSIIIAAGRTGNDSHNLSINIDGGDSVNSVWGWASLVTHHNAFANDGGTDFATAAGDPGLIHQIFPNRSLGSTCYTGAAHLGGNDFFLIWDYCPQYRSEIGHFHGHLPNTIYGCRGRLTRL